MSRKLEICCGDLQSVEAAVAGGADRIELCSSLATGGLTPSHGMIRQALCLRGQAAVHVLIRPREGDFLYTPAEIEAMLEDIQMCRREGVQGIVIGALNPDGTIDMDTCGLMANEAGDMNVTFHRAFDLCKNPVSALEDVIAIGCNRILTSGCAPSALEGAAMLHQLNSLAAGRITIMAGSGVSPENASEILSLTGVNELHASARSMQASRMTFRHNGVAMGNANSNEYSRLMTDSLIVKQLAKILHSQL